MSNTHDGQFPTFAGMTDFISKKTVGYLLERTTRVVKLRFHRAFKELGVDMTPEQWVLLESLYERNDQSQKELADESFKNAPTISRILDVISKKGWVERRPTCQDRRMFEIHLTDSGRETVEKLREKVFEIRRQGWKNLDEDDYENFVQIMNRIFKNYQ